jgi:hypothetical protein
MKAVEGHPARIVCDRKIPVSIQNLGVVNEPEAFGNPMALRLRLSLLTLEVYTTMKAWLEFKRRVASPSSITGIQL